jgi:hypothetical protein
MDLIIAEKWNKGVAIVAQGSSVSQAFALVSTLVYTFRPIVTAIHIPRLLINSTNLYTRLDLVRRIYDKYPTMDIHLLGASPLWCGEIECAARMYPFIRSIDTSMPYVFGRAGMYIDKEYTNLPLPRGDDSSYFTSRWNNHQYSACQYNVETMLKWSKSIL